MKKKMYYNDLTAVTDFGGAENPWGFAFAQYVFASRHGITSLIHIFHTFHTGVIITKTVPVVKTGTVRLRVYVILP